MRAVRLLELVCSAIVAYALLNDSCRVCSHRLSSKESSFVTPGCLKLLQPDFACHGPYPLAVMFTK